MSFFMKPKKKMIRNIAFVAVGLFAASVVLGAGAGALGWLGGGDQAQKEFDEEALERRLEELEREVEANPEDVDALRRLGSYQLEMGVYYAQMEPDQDKAQNYFNDAMDTYDQLTDLEPDDADIWVEKAMAAYRVNNFETARESTDRVLEIEPDHVDGLNLSSHLHLVQGEYEQAIEKWEALIERDDVTEAQKETYTNMIEQAKAMQEATEGEKPVEKQIEENDEDEENHEN